MGKIVKFDPKSAAKVRRSWHGAHTEDAIYAAAASGKRQPLSVQTILLIALMISIGVLIGLRWPQQYSPAMPAGGAIQFGLCHTGGGTNCVVDGDTFWIHGENIRIADIDTPETHPSRCTEEARLGRAATARLQTLLNAEAITLNRQGTDRYGRTLAIIRRDDGRSLGQVLVNEGLARSYDGGRRASWCA